MVAVVALAVLAALAILYALDAKRDRDRARGQVILEREVSHKQLTALLDRAETERRDAAQERSALLNRIQDPVAGVATSLAMLPDPPDLGVDFDR